MAMEERQHVVAMGSEKIPLLQRPDGTLYVFDPAISPAEGTTTADGNPGGTTIIDTTRTEPNDHWNGMALLITSGVQNGQVREITDWVVGTGTFTVAPAFGGQILEDVTYKILANLPADIDVAAIEAKLGEIADAEAEAGAALPRLLWLKNGIRRGTGTILPANTSLYDWILTRAIAGDAMALTPAERLVVQALIINDTTPFPGANIDAAISSRSSHTPANVRQSVCLVGDPANSIGKSLYELYVNRITAARAAFLDVAISSRATEAKQDIIDGIVDAILADTATINWGDITTIDGLIDEIIADIGVFPTANYATFAAYVEDIRTRLIAIVADTNELQTDWADGGRLDLLIDAIKGKTDNLPASPAPANEYDTEMARITANVATEAKQDIIDTNVDDIETDTADMQPRIPRILCHVDFWSLPLQITITSVAGDKGLVDVVVSGLPAGVTIIAVQGMFMCDTVQNTNAGAANYLESTKIQVHKKAAGTDRDAIVREANKTFRFTTDMIRGGTCFMADWATATAAGILAEVATNTTYEMWFDVAEANANNIVLDGAAFGLRIWFTV